MSNSNNLASHIIVQSIHWICVDEAISNPLASLDNLLHLLKEKRDFYKPNNQKQERENQTDTE